MQSDLKDEDEESDAVGGDALEDAELIVQLAGIDLIKELHEDENGKEEGEVSTGSESLFSKPNARLVSRPGSTVRLPLQRGCSKSAGRVSRGHSDCMKRTMGDRQDLTVWCAEGTT